MRLGCTHLGRTRFQMLQHFKSPSLMRCLSVFATMAHTNRKHHQASYGYSFSNSSQPFPVEHSGWGNQGWIAPSVCVIRSVFIRVYALTDFAGAHTFNGASEPLYTARALRPGNSNHPYWRYFARYFLHRSPIDPIDDPRELGAPSHTSSRLHALPLLSFACASHPQSPIAIHDSKSTTSVEQSAGLCVGSSAAIRVDRTSLHSYQPHLIQRRLRGTRDQAVRCNQPEVHPLKG